MDSPSQLDPFRALRDNARGKTSAVRSVAEAATAVRFDPRQSGQLSPAQIAGLEILHKSCAAKMQAALSALLRTELELSLAAIEPLSSDAFVEQLADPSYLVSFRTALGARALMQVDLSLIFPLLDVILGGSGKDAGEARDLTEIEQDILEPMSRSLGRCLQEAWQTTLKADFEFERRWQKSGAATLLYPPDKLLLVSFEFRWQELQGRLLLAFPSLISSALLRKLAPPEPAAASVLPQDRKRLQEQLLDSRFVAELLLPPSSVSVRQLYALQPGDVLALEVRSNELLSVHVAGRNMFLAAPVRCGSRRAAQIQKVLSIIPEREAEERK